MCYILKVYIDGGMKPDTLDMVVLAENQILLEIYRSNWLQEGFLYTIKELKPGDVPKDFAFTQSRVIFSEDAQFRDTHKDIELGIVHKFNKPE